MKHWKKQISVLLMLSLLLGLMVLPVGADGTGYEVGVDDVSGCIGKQVRLNLNLSGNTEGISSLTVYVFYDTNVLTGVDDENAYLLDKDGNATIWATYSENCSNLMKPYAEFNHNAPLDPEDPHYGDSNWAKMSFAYTKSGNTGAPSLTANGVIGRLTFDVKDGIEPQNTSLKVVVAAPRDGAENTVLVDGKDGTFSAVDGQPVTGMVTSYNPNNVTTLQLMQSGTPVYTTTIAATTGSGSGTKEFTFAAVADGTYDLVVTKASHLTYTITGVVVNGSALDLGTLTLLCGDIDGNAYINFTDYQILLNSANYDKETSDPGVNAAADLDGNGWINFTDYQILLNSQNYDKSAVADCTVAYNPGR